MEPSQAGSAVEEASRISPTVWWTSFLWFGLPGLAMLVGVQWVNPRLVANGVPLIWSFLPLLYGPILVVGLAALVAYRRDGHPWTWPAFAERMRLTRMGRREWLWALGGLLVVLVAEAVLEPSIRWLAGHAALRWIYIGLVPTGLLTPYIAQRTRNTGRP